jgi:hypothetical protein
MDVTPIIGILAIVGLVTFFVIVVALAVVLGRLASLEEGDPFFEDEEETRRADDYPEKAN